MWTYNYNYELYHHGVKGMKWGVRRAQKRAALADRRIHRIETTRKQNAAEYDDMNYESRYRNSNPKKSKKLAKSLALNKAKYDSTEVTNKYLIAKQNAKKDKAYKQTEEYKQAVQAQKKKNLDRIFLGTKGQLRKEQLKNLGKSEKRAKGQAAAEVILSTAATIAVATLVANAASKYRGY